MNYQNKKNSIFNPIDKPKSSNILITSQTSLKSFRKAPSMLFTRSKSIRKRTLIENLSNITRKAKPKPNNVLSKPFPLLKILTNKYTPNKTKNLIENLLTPHEVSLNDKNNLHSNESKGLKRNLMISSPLKTEGMKLAKLTKSSTFKPKMTLSDRLLPNLDEMSNPFLNYTRYAYKTKEIMEENAFIIKMKTNALKLSRTTSPRNQVNCKGNLLYACTTRHKEHIDRETTVTKEGRDKGKNINAIERYKFPF